MERWSGKIAVVTGASAGIGAAIVTLLVQKGLKVIGLARHVVKLNKLKSEINARDNQFYPLQCDLTKKSEVETAFAWIKSNVGPVSVLINNAGTSNWRNNILNGDFEDWKATVDLNLLAVCLCTREAVKQMQEANISGAVININGLLGHRVLDIPGSNVLPATKHAVTALTAVLRNELKAAGAKIKITDISPGLVETDLTKDILAHAPRPHIKPKDVAEAVLYVLGTPEYVQVHQLLIGAQGEVF